MLLEKLAKKEARYRELEQLLGDAAVMADKAQYQKLAKEFSSLAPIMESLKEWRGLQSQINDLQKMLAEKHDAEFEELARSELADLTTKESDLKSRLGNFVNPKSEDVDKNIIIEIRAGTGGQEASLFAADLYRMYCKYAESKGWKVEAMSSHESDTGGFKEVIFSISGPGAARRLKWESGAHRVQRIPVTEASGRIHTSAATVAVLFEPEEIDVQIDPKDLKIDVFRSSGPGGQSVNTTDSAIRITHLSSGTVVVCQDERSQLKNKLKAMRVLRARIHEKIMREAQEKTMKDRKAQVGSGDRSEKIRTYNYPDHRVTDHRVGLTVHKLNNVMDGDLDDITEALLQAEEKARLEGDKA